jgi:cytochrome c-type biogenesis protein CcmE
MRKKNKFIIVSLIIIISLIYLIYTGMKETTVYYLTLSELFSKIDSIKNKGIRVSGKVVKGSIKKVGDLNIDFIITDGKRKLPVSYKGIVPDTFKEGIDIVVEGYYNDNIFNANNILVKCPSKYEAKIK